MLDAMRRGAQTWLAKILFALLIVSFGVFWNVSDVFQSAGRGAIAKVGDKEISVVDFQRSFQDRLRSLSRDTGGKLTTEQALAFGLDRQVLEQLIAQAAVRAHADELGLDLSNDALVEGVRNDPAFAGPDGKFTRLGFDGLLRQLNLSEQGFLAIRRDDEVRKQISEALLASTVVPKPMIDELHAWRDEARTIDHVTIDPAKVTVADPDEAKLKETYESNKAAFMTPQYRKAALLVLSPDGLKGEVSLTDDEIKAAYTETKTTYDVPERRRVQQIAFKDKAAAEAARKELVEGKKNFLDVAKAAGASESDVNLGMISKDKLIDPVIADATFALARDLISEPIEGRFATVLVRVIEISEGKESTFDEVKDKVRDKLAHERAEGMIHERFDLVEEGRNAGKTLKEIGEEHKLRFIDAEALSAENKAPDGKTVLDIPNAEEAVDAIFRASVGVQSDPTELPDSTYVWYDVQSITEPKEKPFDEVKDSVKTLYLDKERGRLLDELAGKLVDRLKAGEAFAKVAEAAGNPAAVADAIKRNVSPPGLTTDAVRIAFALPKGGASFAPTSDRVTRVVLQVREIKAAAAPTKEQADSLRGELAEQFANDSIIAYVAALRDRMGVTVNETELRRATGGEADVQ